MYILIGVLYAVVMVFFIALPFFKMHLAKKFAYTCKSKIVEGRYDIPKKAAIRLLK